MIYHLFKHPRVAQGWLKENVVCVWCLEVFGCFLNYKCHSLITIQDTTPFSLDDKSRDIVGIENSL